MDQIDEHIKILTVLINIIIGTGIIVYIHYLNKFYSYKYLKFIALYVILYNILMLFFLFYKYINIVNFYKYRTKPDIFSILIIIIGLLMNYVLIKAVFELRGKILTKRNRKLLNIIYIVLIFISFMIILPQNIFGSDKPKIIIITIFNIFIFLTELTVLIANYFIKYDNEYRNNKKIGKWMSLLFLSRYLITGILLILLLIFIPDLKSDLIIIKVFSAMLAYLTLNISVFIWLRYFFERYAKNILVFDNRKECDQIVKKFNISKREREILELILEGKSNREMEKILFISYNTIKNHNYKIYQKMGIKNRYDLITLFTNYRK